MPLHGINVYGGNSPATVTTNINRIETAFVIAKGTEGYGVDDSRVHTIRKEVAERGAPFGTYHYAWPTQDPVREASHYLTYTQPQKGELVALDLERQADTLTWSQRLTWALTWLGIVEKSLGVKPLIYVNGYWRNGLKSVAVTAGKWDLLRSYPLWLANPAPAGQPTSVDPEWPFKIHQYTSATATWNGNDGNWFGGGYNDLRALAIPKDEVIMSTAQYENLLGAIKDIDTDLTGVSTRLAALDGRVGSLETATKTGNSVVIAAVNAVSEDVTEAATEAVKGALGGFTITTSFPKT